MAARKISAADEEYIRAHAPDMSVRAIAEMIGCSKSTVHRIVKKLGCRVAQEEAIAPKAKAADAPSDELSILQGTAKLLWKEMQVSKGNVLAKLSQELRETLRRISEIEGGALDAQAAPIENGSCIDAICSGITGTGEAP